MLSPTIQVAVTLCNPSRLVTLARITDNDHDYTTNNGCDFWNDVTSAFMFLTPLEPCD